MDNSQDKTNQNQSTALDTPMPSSIEPVEEANQPPVAETVVEESETNQPLDASTDMSDEEQIESSTDETAEADEEEGEDESPAGYKSAMSRIELESLIQRYMDDVEKLKSQIKSEKEMYNASFENDAAYSQAQDAAKETKKKVSEIKQRITQQPAVKDAEMRMSELKEEMKDVQDAISGLAEQYQQVAGTNQIVQDDGQVLEIVRNFKVIRKKA